MNTTGIQVINSCGKALQCRAILLLCSTDLENCTPNMRLHLHLKDCFLDFGPISAFWAFPFERFNGILESFSKNWMKPEKQIMRKIINFQELMVMQDIAPEVSSMTDHAQNAEIGAE